MAEFVFPGGADRTVIIGPTGSGKTVGGAWVLTKQRFNERPWVALDFKNEELWDQVGQLAMRELRFGSMPGKRGLYRMPVHPGNEDELEEWLWRIWTKGNIGLFVDEVSLIPQKSAFKAILRQGRSKRIPVIACTQRPVDCDREVFSESQYRMFYGMEDPRDGTVIRGLFGDFDLRTSLPRHWSYWYDAKQKAGWTLKPVPAPASVAARIQDVAPRSLLF